jgi:hypothetical protein
LTRKSFAASLTNFFAEKADAMWKAKRFPIEIVVVPLLSPLGRRMNKFADGGDYVASCFRGLTRP